MQGASIRPTVSSWPSARWYRGRADRSDHSPACSCARERAAAAGLPAPDAATHRAAGPGGRAQPQSGGAGRRLK
ncbi:MAG: hypothetical protein ACYDHX_10810 [Methanothrix sp.]